MEGPCWFGDPSLDCASHYGLLAKAAAVQGIQFSNSYLVVDIETTGFRKQADDILQIGALLCIDGTIRHNFGMYIQTPEESLTRYEGSDYVQGKIAEGNEGFIKAADVRKFGVPCEQALSAFKQLVDTTLAIPNSLIVGHNLIGFDVPFIEGFSARKGCAITFPRERLFDTGAAFKANELRMLPAENQPLWQFFIKVSSVRAKGVKWNLSHVCERFDLVNKHDLDLANAHDAKADTLFTHYVYLALQERMGQRNE